MSQWRNARNILCMRLGGMGSVLMTTPALRALKHGFDRDALPPSLQPHLTLLTTPSGAAAADHIPEIDRVITYDAPWLSGANTYDATADRRLVSRLDAADYDAVVIFTAQGESALPAALLCMMADIPLRLAHSIDNPHLLLTDWVRDEKLADQQGIVQDARHEVQRQLDLVATVGAYVEDQRLGFKLFDADCNALAHKLGMRGVDLQRPWLVLHPGTVSCVHDDAFEQYLAVVQGIRAQLDCQILLTGGEQEMPICQALQAHVGAGATSLAGELSLGEFGALIAGGTVLLSNGSASVHIAAAVGTPVVDLQSRMQSGQTPWLVPSRVIAPPCAEDASMRARAGMDPRYLVSAVCELWHEHVGRCASIPLPAAAFLGHFAGAA